MSGKLYPNTTQVPNFILDEVMKLLPPAPLKVLLTIARFTYGFQKDSDKIGNKQLCEATGLSRSSAIRGVQLLGDLITIKPGGPGKGANEYSLNLDISGAKLDSLKRRIDASGSVTGDTSSASDTSVTHATQVVSPVSPFQTNLSKPIRGRAKAAPTNPPDPAVNGFKKFWDAEYTKRFETPYNFSHGKDGRLIKGLLQTYGLSTLQDRAVKFFDLDDDWIRTKGGFTIGVFNGQINKLNSTGRIQTQARREMPA